jgi:hypothetical protein
LRSWTHCDCTSLRPLERWLVVWPFELDEPVPAALEDEAWPDDDARLTCVKPPSDVPAFESATSLEPDEADVSGAAGVDSGAGTASSVAGAAELSAADGSAAGAASGDAVPSDAVVVDSIAAELSSAIVAEKRSPANAASEAPAKNKVVKTKVVASRRLRLLGSPAASSGDGLPPKSQLSLRVNHRGIAVRSFWIEPLAATRGAECGLFDSSRSRLR